MPIFAAQLIKGALSSQATVGVETQALPDRRLLAISAAGNLVNRQHQAREQELKHGLIVWARDEHGIEHRALGYLEYE